MDRQQRISLILALTLLAGAGIAVAATGRERSLAVYPAQKMPLKFDHATHLEAGAECVSCHDPARKSQKAIDLSMPKHPECETCHDIEEAEKGKKVDPPSACETCHLGFDRAVHRDVARVVFPTPNVIFNHKVHVDKKVECKVCHSDMTQVGLATRQQLPKMETCLACHDGSQADATCATCHPTTPSGKLQLTFASGSLRPMQGNPFGIDHGPRYEFNHGNRASLDRALCMECHTDNECQVCHDSLQKPLSVHPNDFITLHPVQARVDATKCDSCHRAQSFCISCHERAGVGMNADSSLRATNARVHPNYTEFVETRASPLHHSIAASRDIKQCIACHREETCTKCHAESGVVAGSRQLNPHPPDFVRICKQLAAQNNRACLKCHSESDPNSKYRQCL
jgi:hypothetical protein